MVSLALPNNRITQAARASTESISSKIKNYKNSMNLGCIGGSIFYLMDFLEVPGAFNLKHDTNGNKVEGKNLESGTKELIKSALRCAGYIAVPALITSLAAGGGVVISSIAAVLSFGSGFKLSELFDKILPTEKKLVADACKQKGIDISKDEQLMQYA